MRKAMILVLVLLAFAIIIPKVFADENYVIGFISKIDGKSEFTLIESDLDKVYHISTDKKTAFYGEDGKRAENDIITGKLVKVWTDSDNRIISHNGTNKDFTASKVQYIEPTELNILPRFRAKEKNKYNIYVFYDINEFPDKSYFEQLEHAFDPYMGKRNGLVSYTSYLPTKSVYVNFKSVFKLKNFL